MLSEAGRLAFLQKTLRVWARRHLRDFPWRQTRNPYRVLIAELMLRRTRPGQVLPTYRSFIGRYPSARKLASADHDELRALLAPLGLRWRAENVVALAKDLAYVVPAAFRDGKALRKLPGVGDYVASAIQVIAFNRAESVIDTNVIRVLGRYWGMPVHPEARRRREFRELAARCVPKRDPKRYTLALLDLGASVCTPRRPRCADCPLRAWCTFALNNPAPRKGTPLVKSGERVA